MSGRLLALYRGDEFVMLGTAEQLACRMGCKPESVRWYLTPSARRRLADSRGWRVEVAG